MSFGTSKHRRLLSPFVALLWAAVTVVLAGTAHAADSHGTDHQSSVAASASTDAASSNTDAASSAPSLPSAAADHATGGRDHGGSTDHPAGPRDHGGSTDLTTPQPISNADANTGGANGQCPGGPYCSTRDGSASGNGNGGGKATGEPCAGCVGKADNKNPHGQMPNGSDANAGYECDTNHGIGRTNPAHTGCQSAPQQECVPSAENPCVPPCVVTPQNPCSPPPPECVPTTVNPCVSPPSPPSCSPAPCVSPPIAGTTATNAPTSVSAPLQTLPNTGAPADLVWLAAAALASIIAGTALLLAGRRRAPLART